MHFRQKMIVAAIAAIAMGLSPGLRAGNRPPGSGLTSIHAAMRPPASHRDQGVMAFCDPFAVPFTGTEFPVNDDVPDDDSTLRGDGGQGRGLIGALPIPGAPDAAALVIGRTPAQIDRNFIGVITRNLENGGTASRISRLSDHELAAIGEMAARGSATERAGLLKVLATRLDAGGLVRIANAFGTDAVATAVDAYASQATRREFARMSVITSGSGGTGGGSYPPPAPPRPTIDMTLREIYLEYRTAPIGSLSPSASLAETSMFAGRYLGPAGTAGYLIGTVIHNLIDEFAPQLDDDIGGTIGAMLENFWDAGNQFQQGHYESAFDSLFGFPVTWSSDPFGDWDVSAPMLFYYQSASTCGW